METEVREINETILVKGEEFEVTGEVRFCAHCGSQIFDEELDSKKLNKAYDLYKIKHGLLSSYEIKNIRKRYALSARAFSKLLGFGEKTVTRYENGAIQDEAQNNLMYLMRDFQAFIKIWSKNKKILSASEIKKTELAIEKNVLETVRPLNLQYPQCTHSYSFKHYESTVLGA